MIAEGWVDEDFYYRALAARLNCPFIDRAAALASGFDYRAALRASVARADPARENFDWLLAPRGAQVVDLLKLSGARKRIAVCAPKFFSALARAKGRQALCEDASFALSRADASLSANAPQARRSKFLALTLSAVILVGLLPVSTRLLEASSLFLSALFLGGVYVRSCAIAASLRTPPPRPPAVPDRDLPSYTIIAPLYREAGMAAQFVAALKALDYPVLGSRLTSLATAKGTAESGHSLARKLD